MTTVEELTEIWYQMHASNELVSSYQGYDIDMFNICQAGYWRPETGLLGGILGSLTASEPTQPENGTELLTDWQLALSILHYAVFVFRRHLEDGKIYVPDIHPEVMRLNEVSEL